MHRRYTGISSSSRLPSKVASTIRLRVIFFTFLLSLFSSSADDSSRYSSAGRRHIGATHSHPHLQVTPKESACTHARTHACTQTDDCCASATRTSRVHRRWCQGNLHLAIHVYSRRQSYSIYPLPRGRRVGFLAVRKRVHRRPYAKSCGRWKVSSATYGLHLTPREATANNYRRWFTAPSPLPR